MQILPYLRDEVKRLPEEGNTLRNKWVVSQLFKNLRSHNHQT